MSIGAPCANSFPKTVTEPPAGTDDELVVSETTPTHAHASPAGTTIITATITTAQRRNELLIASGSFFAVDLNRTVLGRVRPCGDASRQEHTQPAHGHPSSVG